MATKPPTSIHILGRHLMETTHETRLHRAVEKTTAATLLAISLAITASAHESVEQPPPKRCPPL